VRAVLVLPVLVLLVLVLALAACGGGDDEATGGDTTTTPTTALTECQEVEAPEPREPSSVGQPEDSLDESLMHTLTFDTSCGTFVVTLDPESARETSASLYALAEGGYYDDTIFHRVVPDFVIQGGDPTQTGGGGPGYSTVDPPATDAKYTKGVVAMAKSPTESAGTSGSQFFVVTGDDIGLPPEYAIVGEVTDGIDTVDRIAALGVGDGPPSQPVVVNTVTAASS
jgi:cyclophilin family peptidyl-prolyl cis-trans isomerase